MSTTQETRESDADILIAGYGPTGATLAALLGRRGWRVTILDKAAAIYDKPRAITADHEALRVFQEIGIADEIAAAAIPHPGTDYLGVDGQVIKRFYPAPPPEPLGWTPNFMFVQPALEAALRRAIDGMGTVRTLLEHQLLDFAQGEQDAQGEQGVLARVRRAADGAVVTLCARYLIAADGASSAVRKQLAPAIEDLAFDEWWLIVDAWVRGPVPLPQRAVQYCRPSRPGTYMVGPGALRRWEIKMLPHETPEKFSDHDAVWRVLGEFVDTSGLEHCRTAVYRFHALVVEQWRHGRVFLAGDAAHQMPPFLGQGMCAGVRDAYNLAWKLDAVMRGQAAPLLLDTYTEERKPHVRTVVGHAKDFGLIIGELDPEAARERDRRLGEELASGRAETVRQRFIPGLEAGLIDRDAQGRPRPGAGELLVQPWVRQGDGPWRRLDDVVGPRFLVAVCSPDVLADVLADVDDALRAEWAALGGRWVALGAAAPAVSGGDVLLLEERDGLLAGWLRERGAVALVARPDRYVYGVARSGESLRRLVRELRSALA
ncbi:MAG: hypothetical protein ABS55_09530 [Lautropia sp. SCN 70-15]|nr:MAG: hypothetical protein ABS55_09530 [Lautropia sp. SCN 70-15]